MTSRKIEYIDFVVGILINTFIIYLLINIGSYIETGIPTAVSPLVFPRFVLLVLLLFAAIFLLLTGATIWRLHRWGERFPVDPGKYAVRQKPEFWLYMGILAVYWLCFDTLGFLLSTPPVMFFIACLLGNRRLAVPFLSFVLFAAAMDFLFFHVMKLALPKGIVPL